MSAAARVISIAIAVLALLAVTPASGASQRPDDNHAGNSTLRFGVHFRDFDRNYVDLGGEGPTVGDLLVFQDKLIDSGTHQQVGVEGGTCTVTAVLQAGFQTHCVGTVQLADGQISFQGLATDAPVKPLAVVGGTDEYRGASGELILVENGDGSNTGQDDGTGTLTITLRDRDR
jgi:hypothetical protein